MAAWLVVIRLLNQATFDVLCKRGPPFATGAKLQGGTAVRRYLNVRLIRLRMMWSSSRQWRAKCHVPHPGLAVIPKLSLKLNVIQSLKALCDNLEEPLISALLRTGPAAAPNISMAFQGTP